jgi:hypothetical protein
MRLEYFINPKQQPGWGLLDNFDGDDTTTIVTVVFAEKGQGQHGADCQYRTLGEIVRQWMNTQNSYRC